MCGICGQVGQGSNAPAVHSVVRSMMDALVHRGPDANGLVQDKSFVFGHQRLSIIDLEHGKQPMQCEDGSVILTYNGEIYNYLELRQELIREGVTFRTFSDTEVLLRLYEKYGEGLLKHINGMFAFAIYDKRKGLFFAGRDHFGIKPFYYTQLKNGNIVFASEIKALLKHPKIKAVPDKDAIQEYLTFQFCLGNKTLFRGIKKLEPGSLLLWRPRSGQKPKVRQYWKQRYAVDTAHDEKFFWVNLRALLQDAASKQLRSDVPLGAYLSGGLDSSTVAVLARKHYGKGLECFTGRFEEGSQFDESSYAKLVARKISARSHLTTPTARDFVNLMPKIIYQLDEPLAGPGVFPQYMVSAFAARKVKVVLGGQGGDEIFGGYARYLIAYLEQCLKGAIYETQEEGRHVVTLSSMVKNLPQIKEYVPLFKEFWREGLFEPMDRRYFRLINRGHDLRKILSDDMKADYHEERLFETFRRDFNSSETQSYINKMLHFDQKTLLPALLHIEDRVSMAVSLESRVPLLDYRIVNLVNSMPPALKFKDGKLKYSLREAVRGLLPAEILNRKDKMGFPVPLNQWRKRGPVRQFIQDVLGSRSFQDRGMWDPDAVKKMLESESLYGRQIWGILCLELWFRTFIDGKNAGKY